MSLHPVVFQRYLSDKIFLPFELNDSDHQYVCDCLDLNIFLGAIIYLFIHFYLSIYLFIYLFFFFFLGGGGGMESKHLQPVTCDEISELLVDLKNTACGWNGFDAMFLKLSHTHLLLYVTSQ